MPHEQGPLWWLPSAFALQGTGSYAASSLLLTERWFHLPKEAHFVLSCSPEEQCARCHSCMTVWLCLLTSLAWVSAIEWNSPGICHGAQPVPGQAGDSPLDCDTDVFLLWRSQYLHTCTSRWGPWGSLHPTRLPGHKATFPGIKD